MDKKLILDRLEMLTTLCEETETKFIPNNHLFNQHMIYTGDDTANKRVTNGSSKY